MIVIDHVTKVYDGVVPCRALDDISISIAPGTLNIIVGPSGSGKTTLLNLIGGLDKPTEGKIQVNGKSIDSLNSREMAKYRNQDVGFIFQSHHLLPEFTVRENILLPYRISRKETTPEFWEYYKFLITTIGIDEYQHSKIFELSGGQQQRVAIARALINRPNIVLADEPGSNLDTKLTRSIFDLLVDLNQKLGCTILLITHKDNLHIKYSKLFEIQDGVLLSEIETEVVL